MIVGMFERRSSRIAGAASLLAGSLLVTSCSGVGIKIPDLSDEGLPGVSTSKQTRFTGDVKGGLPRCFAKPQKGTWPDSNLQPNNVLELAYDAKSESFAGDPGAPSSTTEKKVRNAIVQITRPDRPKDGKKRIAKGSGFVIKEDDGDTFIITAAHVVTPAKMSQIQVIDNQGNKSGVKDGCFIYDNPDGFRQTSLDGTEQLNYDIAVLKTKSDIGKTALRLSNNKPTRGEWGTFMNYQGRNEPPVPALFNGVFARTDGHDRVLTGIQPYIDPNPLTPTQVQPGASGGVVFDNEGAVIGMSYAGVNPDDPLSADELRYVYGITMPGADRADTGQVRPTIAVLMDIRMIERALSSKQLS